MSVPTSGSRTFSTAWAAFWCRRCCGGAVEAGNVSSRKVTPPPSGPTTSLRVRGGAELAWDIVGKQAEPHRDHLAILSQPTDRLIEEGALLFRALAEVVGQATVGPAKGGQHLAGVEEVEEINEPGVFSLHDANFQRLHEPADSQPEVIPHQDDALQPLAIALPQGLHQLGVLFSPLGMEPLLELAQHQQHLLVRFKEPPLPQRRQSLDQS